MGNNRTNPDSHLANYTPNDPTCPICKKSVEPQHTPTRDRISGLISHDYCLRTETTKDQAIRVEAIEAAQGRAQLLDESTEFEIELRHTA